MPDFGGNDLRDALDDAPDVPDVSDDAVIGRDEPSDDSPTAARRDRDDESLREVLEDIRRLDDSEPRPAELRDDDADVTISTATVAAVVIGLGAAGLAVTFGVVPA